MKSSDTLIFAFANGESSVLQNVDTLTMLALSAQAMNISYKLLEQDDTLRLILLKYVSS